MYLRRDFLRTLLGLAVAGGEALSRADEPANGLTVHQSIRRQLEQAPLSMLFQGKTPEEFQEWKRQFRAKLQELLGDSTPPDSWSIQEEATSEYEDHTRYQMILQAEGHPDLPVYLLLPQGATARNQVPGVVCLHGHGAYGYEPIVGRTDIEGVARAIQSANYDYGLQFVRQGYAVVAPCLIPFGRRLEAGATGKNDPCAIVLVRMLGLGQLPITSNLRDVRWALSLLQQREEVFADRLGCAGLSYGGRMTMLATAIDERIKVAAVSGALNLMQERMRARYSCGVQVIRGLLKYGDYSEIGSLIAPRPCVWEVGSRDSLIVPGWSDRFRERLKTAYLAADAGGNLFFDDFEGGHRWHGKLAYQVFRKRLHPA